MEDRFLNKILLVQVVLWALGVEAEVLDGEELVVEDGNDDEFTFGMIVILTYGSGLKNMPFLNWAAFISKSL